jgi:hypothetical protein
LQVKQTAPKKVAEKIKNQGKNFERGQAVRSAPLFIIDKDN